MQATLILQILFTFFPYNSSTFLLQQEPRILLQIILKYYDDEPDLQLILVEESCQHWLNRKRLLKLKEAKLKYKQKSRKVSVSGLLKKFNQQHIDSSGHPNSVILLDVNEIYGMYL